MKKTGFQELCVLIIDDEIGVAELISEIIKEAEVNAQIVTRFENVAAALQEFSPAIVFLDLNLGDHSGMEVLDLMATADSEANIILMSGMDGSALEPARKKAKQLQLNIASGLGKPFDVEEVEASLQAALDKD